MPRDVAVAHPRAEEVKASPAMAGSETPTVRRLTASTGGPPVTHLLSNGRYAVMLTSAGAGYSRWRDIAVTRWREDATRDDWGSFIILRDIQSGRVWSAGQQPVGNDTEDGEVVFGEDRAEFIRRDGTLMTNMDVLVSGEDDGEVRRLSLTNSGRRTREIELTSYAEIVLATPAADNAHPAFSKMFVETEYLAEFGALIATRRRRSREEQQVWAAHFAIVEGEIAADPEYETDRARFLGRGRTVGAAAAIADGRPLSNTVGTVLDPIFSLRYSRKDSARQGRAGLLLDRSRIVPGRASGSRRQASRSQRLRPGEDAGLDAGPGPTSPSRRQSGGGGRLSEPCRADPIRRPALQGLLGSPHPRRGFPVRPLAASEFPATCRSSSCASTRSRTSPRFASCCALMNTGA